MSGFASAGPPRPFGGGSLPHSKEADIAANREARVTGSQMLALWWSGLWRLMGGLPTATLGVALTWGAPLPSIPPANFFFMAIGIGLLGCGAYLSWRGFSFVGDSITPKVTYITGQLKGDVRTGSKGAKSYFMVVGPVRSRIWRKSTFNALPVGMVCNVYYTSGSGQLLSVEPATAGEPHPSLRFGGDEAHAWDRLRWSWLLIAVSAYGVVAGTYDTITAHPAHWAIVSGAISEYHVGGGKSHTRYFHIDGSGQEYNMDSIERGSPPAPELYIYVGDRVDLYVNSDQASDVLAMRLRETLYAGDLYLHPEHQFWGMIWSAAPIALVSAAFLVLMAWALAYRRKHPSKPVSPPPAGSDGAQSTEVQKRAHGAMRM